jgi:DNA-directed RNA polymerase subunit F
MEIVSEELVNDAEAKEILEKRESESDLKYEQKNTLDILRKFVDFSSEKIKNLVTELKKLEKLRERHIIAIANFLPEDKDDLRAVMHKDYTILSEDEINLILETVKKNV